MSMGMRYSCGFGGVAVSAAQDLFELLAPTDATIVIISARLGQSSDFGDAAAEGLRLEWVKGEGSVTSGSGGTAGTENPLMTGLPAAGAVCELNNTTRMVVGTGALVTYPEAPMNIQIPTLLQPIPDEFFIVSPGDRMTLAIPVAPGDAITMDGVLTWEEIGG